jgi:hypothetical protein
VLSPGDTVLNFRKPFRASTRRPQAGPELSVMSLELITRDRRLCRLLDHADAAPPGASGPGLDDDLHILAERRQTAHQAVA